jgi:hypothetical protein
MKSFVLPLLLLPLLFVACEKNSADLKLDTPDVKMDTLVAKHDDGSQSFFPMEVGNYWKKNSQNYTEITDTVRINKKLFYKFRSLVDGDGILTQYFRIDENNQLVASSPGRPDLQSIYARFNDNLDDHYFTLNDKSANDCLATVIEKTAGRFTLAFKIVYDPQRAGQIGLTTTYIKGIGFEDDWTSIKINGKVIK